MSDKKNALPDDLIYSQTVIEFITTANEFCLILEGMNTLSREEFIEQVYNVLILLQLKSIMLPVPKIIENTQTESFVNEADWHFIDNSISRKLGSLEIYSELREPLAPENSIELSLSECLADTYQDLKDFSQLYQFGNAEAITQGLTECKTNYEQVWGPRIMIVIREFHNLLYGNKDLSDENTESDKSNTKGDNWVDQILSD